MALEQWLRDLGAEPAPDAPSRWTLQTPTWSAELTLEQEDLRVTWLQPEAEPRQCCLPYGLSRADVEAAIQAGP
ncbi:DUF3143 domain-containing protein [Synechococcus sp. CC9616]|uniref:DUF3143 domain-containing protein n=1 Tax=Synechococcus sp. CC9616 TaxID=110663 RepID=UPI0004AF1804|nr:DUF3143 domain-containing protein [Synechococcus sp. CC9616]